MPQTTQQPNPLENSSTNSVLNFCTLPDLPPTKLPKRIAKEREQLILQNEYRWLNGTVLRYYFYDNEDMDFSNITLSDGTPGRQTWTADEAEKDVVRKAFA